MDPISITATAAIGLAFGCYLLDANLAHAADLAVRWLWTHISGLPIRLKLWLSLKITRLSFGNGPIARYLRHRELESIRRNPAYSEFFDNDHPSV